MTDICGYHAHLYFDEKTVEQAVQLAHHAGEIFDIKVGRVHRKPIGPHPQWSCQLAFAPELFEKVIPWLATHRKGLTIFIHPDTGNFLRDHVEYAMWMGVIEPLRLTEDEEA